MENAKAHMKGEDKRVIIFSPSADAFMFAICMNYENREGLMNMGHAITATQNTMEGPFVMLWCDGYGATLSIILVSIVAAKTVSKVISELNGKFSGMPSMFLSPGFSLWI
ncbi:hypothetical protein U0070_020832 [Myodes glareolus]|uniref:glyceraldehyde-3-phosphate dehydrogenase (phosphorylating) n=1 Tax=Myodes glareolus TaxID=447135 RepID=A0AAW0IPZ6_MYOGA